jgi:hypothetical protein
VFHSSTMATAMSRRYRGEEGNFLRSGLLKMR